MCQGFINNVCFGFNTSDKTASRSFTPQAAADQLSTGRQHAGKQALPKKAKKKKGRASQCLLAEPHTHAEPALIVSLLWATFPNHRAFEHAAAWKAHSTPPGNSFPSLSSQVRILSELRLQGHPSTTSFSLVSLRPSTPPGVYNGSQQNLSVTVHRSIFNSTCCCRVKAHVCRQETK